VQTFLLDVAHSAVGFWFVVLFCSLVFFKPPTIQYLCVSGYRF